LKPTQDITRGLDALTDATCHGHYKKAVAPALFLAAAICAGPLAAESSSSAAAAVRPLPGLVVSITRATLPVAAGLGSSAAVSVSLAAAILDVALRWAEQPGVLAMAAGAEAGTEGAVGGSASAPSQHSSRRPSEEALRLINAWAYSSETLFHGAPSGLDNTVAT
jgi:mevalonate kinase